MPVLPPDMRYPALLPCLAIILLVAAITSLAIGAVPIDSARLLAAATGHGDRITTAILFDLRLPRAGYLRNPLAEPAVLGASNAAALGAVGALYFGLSELHALALPILAVLMGVIALVALFALAGHSESPLSLILAGIAISTLAGAGISLALNLSPNPFAGMEITTWLLGSIENRSIDHVWIALPCIAIGIALLLVDGRALDALSLGEDGAQALGVDLKRTRLRLLLGVGIGVGGAVAVSGAIGFIGLIVPHLVRPLTDRSPSALLLPSLLAGAALLTLADVAVRLIPTQSELKLGVVTAFLGVPVFLVHLLRERRLW